MEGPPRSTFAVQRRCYSWDFIFTCLSSSPSFNQFFFRRCEMFAPNVVCLTCFPPWKRSKTAKGVLRKKSIDLKRHVIVSKCHSFLRYTRECDSYKECTISTVLMLATCTDTQQHFVHISCAAFYQNRSVMQKSINVVKWRVTVTSNDTFLYSVYSYGQLLRLILCNWHKFVENVGKLLLCC